MDPITEQLAWWQDNGFMPWCAHEALYGDCPAVMTWPRLEVRMRRDFGPNIWDLELAAVLQAELNMISVSPSGAYRERRVL